MPIARLGMVLSRRLQPLELPSPSVSQVPKSFILAVLRGTYVMTGTGSQASLIGDLSNTTSADEEAVSYPIANYTVDGSPGESFTKSTVYQGACLVSHYS